VQAPLQLPQVLVELTAQRSQPLVVSGFQSQGDRSGFGVQDCNVPCLEVVSPS
jgi:hypothetical protein